MDQDLSKKGDDETINFSKELNINIDEIKKCEHLKIGYFGYNVNSLLINDVKQAIYKMNVCYYKQTDSYIYNVIDRIKITFNDNKEIIILLSDCGQ